MLVVICGSVNNAGRARRNYEKSRKACVWKSSFTRITGHQLVFLSECKDVVVSCVIIEPTYNHEREGRGNFVQEGKSGELASPPWLSHSADSRCGWPPVIFNTGVKKTAQTPTFIEQSIAAAASRSLSFSRFVIVSANLAPNLTSNRARLHWLYGANHCSYNFCSQTINRMASFFLPLSLSLTRSLSLSLSHSKLGSEVTLNTESSKVTSHETNTSCLEGKTKKLY